MKKSNLSRELPEKYKHLKKGTQLKIKNQIYTIKNKSTHEEGDHIHPKQILYNLGNDYWLDFHWDWSFFKMKEKRLLFGILGISRKADYILIKSIQILN